MWPLSTEPRPVRPSDTTSAGRTAHPGVVGCRFRPQGASAVGVHKASLTPPSDDVSRPKESAWLGFQFSELVRASYSQPHVITAPSPEQ